MLSTIVGVAWFLAQSESTFQNGQTLTMRWVNGTTSTPTFFLRDLTRDATTGWITASRDAAGLPTSYAYDVLGRATQVTPPATAAHDHGTSNFAIASAAITYAVTDVYCDGGPVCRTTTHKLPEIWKVAVDLSPDPL